MSRIDCHVVGQGEQAVADGFFKLLEVAALQVCTAYAALEQYVAREEDLLFAAVKCQTPGGMSRHANGFQLVDSVGKKLKVATEVARAIGLDNVTSCHERVEDEQGKFDFVVSRAVMDLDKLVNLTRKNISPQCHNALPNGVICLKGGDVSAELRPYKNICDVTDISDYFDEEYFKTKRIIFVPLV